MKITCQDCQAEYNIADDKLPAQKAKATCKKCGGVIIINPAARPTAPQGDMPADLTSAKIAASRPADLVAAYPELAGQEYAACNLTEVFPPDKKGRYQNSRNKLTVKILATVAPRFGRMLEAGETVHRICHGVAYYPSEIFFGNGYFTILSNYYAIVATDRRLLFINVNSRLKKTTHLVFQLPYDHIKQAKFGTVFSRIFLTPVVGKRKTFTHMKRFAVKELKEFLQGKMAAVTAVSVAESQPLDLCPACYKPVVKGVSQCPACKAEFKKPFTAFWRSLVLPGLGDIYLGHKALGSLELLGSLVVWAIIILMLLGGRTEDFITAGIILLFVNVSDGILTYFMGKKGYILA